MKLKIVTSLVLLSFVAVAFPVSAEEGSTGQYYMPTPGKVRVEAKAELEARKASSTERRMEAKTAVETRQASSTQKRVEMQRGLAKRKAEQASKVLLATIERLEKIVARLDSRIEKVAANGGTTTEAVKFSAEAKLHLREARNSLTLFSSIDLSADKAAENFERVRAAGAEVKMHIRAAHQSLMKALRSLMGQRDASDKNATSTSR